MLKNVLITCILIFSIHVQAQIKPEVTAAIDKNIMESRQIATENPAEATIRLKKIEEQSERIGYKVGMLKSGMVLTLLYYNDGNYKEVIAKSLVTEKLAKELQNTEYISDSYRMRGIAYGEMDFVNECFDELNKALEFADKIEQPHIREYKTALIYESIANTYDKKGDTTKQLYYRKKSINETKKLKEGNQISINAKYQNLAYQYASIGLVYSNLKVNDSALYYFEKALKIYENKRYNIYTNGRATLLSDMAKFYYSNKNYNKAITFAKKAEGFEKETDLPYIKRDIYESLFNSYAETNKIDSSKYYLKLYTFINDSLIKVEKESIYTPVKQIISDNETENKATVKTILIIAGLSSLFLMLAGWLFWRRKNTQLHKGYEKLIDKLKLETAQPNESVDWNLVDDNQEASPETDTNPKEKSIYITDSTINSLMSKLERFEKSNKYIKKEVTLAYLASYLGTNTKYLSEIIKENKGKSFNDYINGLRIDYIAKQLYEEPKFRDYKISHLGELCGFSSRQVFALVFKKHTGISPSFFLDSLKKEIDID